METLFLETVMGKRMISDILEQPDAYLVVKEVSEILDSERKKRINFYNEITEQEKVEFINGEIIVHSPVKMQHNEVSLFLAQLFNVYARKYKLGFVGIEKIMITLTRNDYEPDVCFFKLEKSKHFKKDQILFPAPDLVVEVISPSTEHRDRGLKFKDYAAHQIEEYWIIDSDYKTVEQYHLVGKEYFLVQKSSNGMIESFVIEGFKIPIIAIFDESENIKATQSL